MKNILIISYIVALLLPYTVHAATNAITTDRARVRNAPSTINTATLIVIPKGVSVTILEKQSEWSRVVYNNTEGWTANWLLQTTSTEAPAQSATNQRQGRYTSNARVRSTGSATGNIITTLPLGTIVTILEEKNDWYRIQTTNGVIGWTANWLITPIIAPSTENSPQLPSTPTSSPISFPTSDTITISPKQIGTVPANVDTVTLNAYWLERINTLRRAKGLRELVLDQRFVDTASDYAGYMGTSGATNHERADGKTMHQWIDTKRLPFTTRYSIGGWQTNYFTENISWGYAAGNTEAVKKILDETMTMYLNEVSYNGAHYRTIYHADWNTVGAGFYFKDLGNGKYQVYCVFHYGSLVL